MIISDLITYVDDVYSNTLSDSSKIIFINKMEQKVYSEIIKEKTKIYLDVETDVESYPVDEGKIFEDILVLKVNNVEYTLGDVDLNAEKQYFKKNGEIALNPIPTQDSTDGIVIFYRKLPELKTLANIDTDTTSIIDDFGFRWIDLYRFFLSWEINISLKEFIEANNWAALYNEKESELFNWYKDKQVKTVSDYRKTEW
jgi:hypothetical protein